MGRPLVLLLLPPLAWAVSRYDGPHELMAAHAVSLAQEEADDDASAHFTRGAVCYEAERRTLEGALALAKAGPLGAAFIQSFSARGACPSTNTTASTAHACYPGVSIVYEQPADLAQHQEALEQTLANFTREEGMGAETARRLVACSCHPESQTAVEAGSSPDLCNATALGVGSAVHVDARSGSGASPVWVHGSREELLCVQGPWQHQLAALAVLKSSPLLLMHLDDHLRPVSCAARGYGAYLGIATPPMPTLAFGDERCLDHCYPPSTLWAREEINSTNADVNRTLDVEDAILGRNGHSRGFDTWLASREHGGHGLNSTPECNCLPGSNVREGRDPGAGASIPSMCRSETGSGIEKLSPIRDWWGGYANTPRPRDPGSPQHALILASEARGKSRRERAAAAGESYERSQMRTARIAVLASGLMGH